MADQLVGISHECDFPPVIRRIPVMVEPLVGAGPAASEEIDKQVKEKLAAGEPLYRLDEQAFHEAQPDLILMQNLCHVCAVTPDQLARAVEALPRRPQTVTLSPVSLSDIFADVERIAEAVHQPAKGRSLVSALRNRLDTVQQRTGALGTRPRVVCIEWLAPLYLAGHWVPEMVDLAGGRDVMGLPGSASRKTTWKEIEDARPDILLLMPCGYSIKRTMEELRELGQKAEEWTGAMDRWPDLYVVDAASYFSRPGPRLIDGVELLADIFHPCSETRLDPARATRLRASVESRGRS